MGRIQLSLNIPYHFIKHKTFVNAANICVNSVCSPTENFMLQKTVIRLLGLLICLSVSISVSYAAIDDWTKLYDQQFKLQQQIMEQQFRQMQQELRTQQQLIEQQMQQRRINDLTHGANLRKWDTIAGYGFDLIMDAAMHGISWSTSTSLVIPGVVQTSSNMAAVFHTSGLQTVLSHNRMHWTALTGGLKRIISPSGETQLMLPLRWHGRGTLPDWYQPSLAETYAGRISRITQPVLTIALTAGSAGQTFLDTAQYIGRSMQIINPLMPETRITFPDMGLKLGYTISEGLHNLKNWSVDLTTNRIRSVQFETTRIIPIDSQIDLGSSRITRSGFLRETQITTTPTTAMERFMLKLYPVGSYFDPMTSTGTTTRQWSVTTREITTPNMNTTSNWTLPQQSWNMPQQNWNLSQPSWNYNSKFQTNWNNFGTNTFSNYNWNKLNTPSLNNYKWNDPFKIK